MMRLKANMTIYTYWNALRRDGGPPLREDLNPMALGPYLPDIFVLSWIAGCAPCFRLAGSGLYDRFLRELRGAPFSALWRDSAQQDAVNVARNAMQDGNAMVLSAAGMTLQGSRCGIFEMLLLPLRTTSPGEFRLMGTLIPESRDNTTACAPAAHLSMEGYMPVSMNTRRSA